MIPTAVVGAGGHGRDLAAIIDASPDRTFVGYYDDQPPDHLADQTLGPALAVPDSVEYVIGVNDPNVRHRLAQGLKLDAAAVLVHPTATVGPRCHLGKGAVVAAGAVLDCEVTLGWHTHLHTGVTVTRTWILPYTTVCPGVHIGGGCVIGHRCLIGAGATVLNLVGVSHDVTVGAGAAVTTHLAAGTTYVGVPAQPLAA